jgi:RNA polymerase sigma factor (sigma-70 family)
MQTSQETHKSNRRHDRIPHIETGYESKSAEIEDSGGTLAVLVRRAKALRGGDPDELTRVINEILIMESWSVKQLVTTHGSRQTGNRWVDPAQIDDVTNVALHRVAKFLRSMDGSSVGELRAGIKECVRFAVIDYVRKSASDQSVAVDPSHFTGTIDPEDQQYAGLAGHAAANGAEDRVLFKEDVGRILELEPRAAEVLQLRLLVGLSAKEVAEKLDLSPANVDQILSRSVKKLARLYK